LGATAGGINVTVNVNGTSFVWNISSDLNMVAGYESLLALINLCGEPVTASYVNAGDHSQGIYLTANVPGTPFTCTLVGGSGTLAEANVTPNSIGDSFNFNVYFDDGTSVQTSGIPLSGPGQVLSKHIPLNKQAKLVQYEATCSAQSTQLAIQRIKYYFTPTMLK
jgi:hypothetical protein